MSSDASSPTARKRQLGIRLRLYREGKRLEQQFVAERLGCDRSKIMRIEQGKSKISHSDLDALLDLYDVSDQTTRDQLWDWARETRQRGWWVSYDPDERTSIYVGFETAAVWAKSWNNWVLPGLFQTPEYARAVLVDNPDLSPEAVTRQVELRQERQARLRAGKFQTWAVIDAGVLRRSYPGRAAMYAQLTALADACTWPGVHLQILPAGSSPALLRGAFSVLVLDNGDQLVHAEGVLGDQWASDRSAVRDANLWFDTLRVRALDSTMSRSLILATAQGVIDGFNSGMEKEHLQQSGVVRGSTPNDGHY